MQTSLFIPCLVDRFLPEVGVATTELLRKAGVTPAFDSRQTCCGQPAFNAGYPDEALPLCLHFLDVFANQPSIVCPSGSCVAMVRDQYALLPLNDDEAGVWGRVSRALEELAEFLVSRNLHAALNHSLRGRIVVHQTCHHLRFTRGAPALAELLARIDRLEVLQVPQSSQCCGFGGVFSMRLPVISDTGRAVGIASDSGADWRWS